MYKDRQTIFQGLEFFFGANNDQDRKKKHKTSFASYVSKAAFFLVTNIC